MTEDPLASATFLWFAKPCQVLEVLDSTGVTQSQFLVRLINIVPSKLDLLFGFLFHSLPGLFLMESRELPRAMVVTHTSVPYT